MFRMYGPGMTCTFEASHVPCLFLQSVWEQVGYSWWQEWWYGEEEYVRDVPEPDRLVKDISTRDVFFQPADIESDPFDEIKQKHVE